MNGICVNPYHAEPGPALDKLIHQEILGETGLKDYPRYSTDPGAAQVLKSRAERAFKVRIFTGKTRIPAKPFFARYEVQPGNPTESLAETASLAICRVVLLLGTHRAS